MPINPALLTALGRANSEASLKPVLIDVWNSIDFTGNPLLLVGHLLDAAGTILWHLPRTNPLICNAAINLTAEWLEQRYPSNPTVHGLSLTMQLFSSQIVSALASASEERAFKNRFTRFMESKMSKASDSADAPKASAPPLTSEQRNTLAVLSRYYVLAGAPDVFPLEDAALRSKALAELMQQHPEKLQPVTRPTSQDEMVELLTRCDRLAAVNQQRRTEMDNGVREGDLTAYADDDIEALQVFMRRHAPSDNVVLTYGQSELSTLDQATSALRDWGDDLVEDGQRVGWQSLQEKLFSWGRTIILSVFGAYISIWWVALAALGVTMAGLGTIYTYTMFGYWPWSWLLWANAVTIIFWGPAIYIASLAATKKLNVHIAATLVSLLAVWGGSTNIATIALFRQPPEENVFTFGMLSLGAVIGALVWSMVVKGFDNIHPAISKFFRGLSPATTGGLGDVIRAALVAAGVSNPDAAISTIKEVVLPEVGWGGYAGTLITIVAPAIYVISIFLFLLLDPGSTRILAGLPLGFGVLFIAESTRRNRLYWEWVEKRWRAFFTMYIGYGIVGIGLVVIASVGAVGFYNWVDSRLHIEDRANALIDEIDNSLPLAEPRATAAPSKSGESPACDKARAMIEVDPDSPVWQEILTKPPCQ